MPFSQFTNMEVQRLHHAMMHVVNIMGLNDPTRLDLLEWLYEEIKSRGEEE